MSSESAATSEWLPAGRGRPLVHWGQADWARMTALLQDCCAEWQRDWGVRTDACVSCGPATAEESERAAVPIGARGLAAAWRVGDPRTQIAFLLFGTTVAPGGVAADVSDACERDAWTRLATALQLDPCDEGQVPSRAPVWRRWDGAVVAKLPFGASILLNATTVEGLQGCRAVRPSERLKDRAGTLVAVEDALVNTPYPVEVQLDGCELDIGTLRELRVGDVLRIRQELDSPAVVRSSTGVPLFSGFMTRSRGRKAVELGRCDPRTSREMP